MGSLRWWDRGRELGSDGAEGGAIEVLFDSSQGFVDGGGRLFTAFVEGSFGDGGGGAAELGEGGFVADEDFDDGLFAVVGGHPGEAEDGIESASAIGFDLQGD
jgi:hypothetical protein